jgi:DNA-binding NtrC family response regulator
LRSTPIEGSASSLYDALSPDALSLLRNHAWEGNFRELTNLAERLPHKAAHGGINAATCRAALERGSIRPVTRASPLPNTTSSAHADWALLATRAVHTFVEDHGREPTSWDDQKEWNEKYLKPLIFFHLSGAASQPVPADDDALSSLASRSATQVQADRGTAAKQLARYFERYRG